MPLRTLLGGVALACVAGRADAADSRPRISISPRSYADALIDLGLQTNVSILGTASCGVGGRVALSGRYSLEEALSRILDGAPCRYRIVDGRTVRIAPAPQAPAAGPAREPPRAPSLVSEVVVTATKRPMALARLPAGVSAISGDQAAATGAVDVGGTVGQLAGVLTTNLGPGRDKLLIRGLSDGAFTGRTRSTVGTYLDDAPINYNAPDPDLRLVDIDRIEVVRGPQGALYGSGAVAGVYRIVTRKPDLDHMEAGVLGSYAWTRGGAASHEVEGYVSLPILKDRIAARLVAYEDVQGGYLDNVNLRIANVDQTRRSGGRLAVRAVVSENWRVDLTAATQTLHSNDTQYVISGMAAPIDDGLQRIRTEPVADGGVAAPAGRRNQIREAHDNDFSYVGGVIKGDFDWGGLTSSFSYVRHVFSSQFDATAGLGDILGLSNLVGLGAYVEATRSNMLVQDLVLHSSGAGRFDWLVGVYGAKTIESTPSSLDLLTDGASTATVYTENRKDRRREAAIYGEGTYELSHGWSATAGGRLFENRVHTTADLDIIQPYGPRSFDRSRTFQGFSPKISLQKEFATGELIYALVAEGYRPGGFNSSGFFPIRASRTTFAPDQLRNYEVGTKFRRFDNRLGVRAAAYYNAWSNIQTDRYRESGLAYTANVGDARIYGLEAEATYDWPFGLSVQLNGLLSDSETKNPNPAFVDPVTKELPGVPKVSGGMLAVYQRPLSNNFTLRLVGEANYVGRSALSFDASQSSRMGHYLRARLSAEIANDTWRVTAFVSNPFDDAGDTFAYGNPFSFSKDGVRQATPQRPRTFGLRLAAGF